MEKQPTELKEPENELMFPFTCGLFKELNGCSGSFLFKKCCKKYKKGKRCKNCPKS